LGDMVADRISRRDVTTALEQKAATGKGIAANRAQSLISAIFAWGVNEGLVNDNPARGLKKRVTETARERKLSPEEMRKFWLGIGKAAMPDAARDVLKLALLTGQRLSELCGAEASEFDFAQKLWTIPGARSKNKRSHAVPLAPLTLELFQNAFGRSGCKYAFAGRRSRLAIRPVNRRTVSEAWGLARGELGLDDCHIHDLRRSMASQLGEMGFSDFDIGLVLNHARAGVTQIYNKSEYTPQKLAMLTAWERRLGEILEGREPASNVVPMARKA
jgi:integrase